MMMAGDVLGLASSATLLSMDTPPKKPEMGILGVMYLLNCMNSFKIWCTNYRVGTMIKHWCGKYISSYSGSIICRIDRTKTAVLPVPDLAWQIRLFPWRISTIPSRCTSLGYKNFCYLIALFSSVRSASFFQSAFCYSLCSYLPGGATLTSSSSS